MSFSFLEPKKEKKTASFYREKKSDGRWCSGHMPWTNGFNNAFDNCSYSNTSSAVYLPIRLTKNAFDNFWQWRSCLLSSTRMWNMVTVLLKPIYSIFRTFHVQKLSNSLFVICSKWTLFCLSFNVFDPFSCFALTKFREENVIPELLTVFCWHTEHILSWYSTFATRVQVPIEWPWSRPISFMVTAATTK